MSRASRLRGLGYSFALMLAAGGPAAAQPRGIHHFQLTNGLDVIVAVRPELRLAAVNLTAAIGAIDDPREQAGMAHVLEHVTLGGSVSVGSLQPEAEKLALAKLDQADQALREARHERSTDPERLALLTREFEQAHQAARQVAESGEIIGGRLEGKGAIGLNATTNSDATQYFGWIPASQLELWISLEADRLKNPIFRRFYSEREVVLQEVEALTHGRPTLQERVMADVFPEGAQSQPRAGDPTKIREIDRPQALAYFHRYYRPENLAIAVVGNVDPAEVRQLCERYLGDWRPAGPAEPLPAGSKGPAAVRVRSFNSVRAPIVFFAFPRPPLKLSEAAGLEALAELLNSPELSPLRRRMIDVTELAWSLSAEASYPSEKRPSAFLLRISGSSGVEHEKLIREATAILRKLRDVPDEDLTGAMLQAEMRLAGELEDPPTLAALLAFHQAVHDDWELPFKRLESLRRLSLKEVRAVGRKVLRPPEPAAEPSHGS